MPGEPIAWSEVRLTVPFHDLDPLKVVWHGHYLKYFEIARSALYKRQGLDHFRYFEETGIAFPIIRSTVKHLAPLKFDDVFTCKASLVEASVKIVMDFEIRRLADGVVCAVGRTEQAAVRAPEMSLELAIPEDVRAVLGGR